MSLLRQMHIPALVLLLSFALSLGAQDWKVYPHTPDGSLITFPEDEGWHPSEAIEWWYIAGHLEGHSSGIPYSFMLTYFYYPVDTFGFSYDGFRILNISRDDTGEFQTETMPVIIYNELDTNLMHIDARLHNGVNEFWYHKEESDETLIPFEYELSTRSGQDSLVLSLTSLKRPLIPGGDGLFNQGASSYTYYYSLTGIDVEGRISFEGSSDTVTGSAWIDRQYGSFNPQTSESYEWFFVQLSNGMDLNIWNLFTPDKQLPDDPAYRHLSAYVDEDTQYTTHEFELDRLSWALMPGTNNCYAQSWRLQSNINQLDLQISTLHHNSEVRLPFYFFEGATSISGQVDGVPVSGIGFAELVNIYEAPDIKLVSPKKRWNENFPIRWTVDNPDDGRPLLYDLAFSTDQGDSWTPVTEGISDTLFYWNNHNFADGDSCWFKVDAYTEDDVLQGSDISTEAIRYDILYNSIEHRISNEIGETAREIYPNPARDRIWLIPSTYDGQTFQIVDFSGRSLMHGTISREGIDIENLERGIYLIILDRSGKQVWRFIKE